MKDDQFRILVKELEQLLSAHVPFNKRYGLAREMASLVAVGHPMNDKDNPRWQAMQAATEVIKNSMSDGSPTIIKTVGGGVIVDGAVGLQEFVAPHILSEIRPVLRQLRKWQIAGAVLVVINTLQWLLLVMS